MINKRGRPRKTDGKNSNYLIRMSAEEASNLDEICEKTGKSKADILREGLRMQYNLFKFR